MIMSMNFTSDNAAGACPEVMAALMAASAGTAPAYGEDAWTAGVQEAFRLLFDHPVAVFPVLTGTAANALALAAVMPPYGIAYCHKTAHVHVDECGAPEFFTGGCKLIGLDGWDGKLAAADIDQHASAAGRRAVHQPPPAAVSISQATEWGTLYSADEIREIAAVSHSHGMALHMDGARFANAVAALGCAPADLTWRAGVDVLSFGATKNGAWAAEAVVFFDAAHAGDMAHRRKRGGHLLSKMRFVSAQLAAVLDDNLWLRNARQANRMAGRLAAGLASLPGARLVVPAAANEVFVELPRLVRDGLLAEGFRFYPWPAAGPDAIRLVASFATHERDVDLFLSTAHRLSSSGREPAPAT